MTLLIVFMACFVAASSLFIDILCVQEWADYEAALDQIKPSLTLESVQYYFDYEAKLSGKRSDHDRVDKETEAASDNA